MGVPETIQEVNNVEYLNCPIFMRFLRIFAEIRVGSKQ